MILRDRAIPVTALLALALLNPWTPEIRPAGFTEDFGATLVAGWAAAVATAASTVARSQRRRAIAVAAGGAALAAWAIFLTWRLQAPAVRALPFHFSTIDVLGSGWYFALLALAVAADGCAAAARDRPRALELGAHCVMPGLGLVRLGATGLGRWIVAVAGGLVFLLHVTAVAPLEFADYGRSGTVPPNASPVPAVVTLVALGALWAGATVATARRFSRR